MGFRGFVGTIVVIAAAVAAYGAYAPETAAKLWPASGPYAQKLHDLAFRGRKEEAEATTPADKGPPPALVSVAPIKRADFPLYLDSLGQVQAFNTVTVRTRVDGQVMKIAFTEGQMVKAGDLLAQIDPRPFQATLDQAKAKKNQDEANLANDKLDLQRFTTLAKQSFATQQQLDTQNSLVAQLTASIPADQAAIDAAQVQFDYATIRAPIAGRTGFRLVDEGNIVNAAQQTGIVTIAQLEPISVVFTEPEQETTQLNQLLAAGETPEVVARSSDGAQMLAAGNLILTDNQVDTATGSIRLKAEFANKDHKLWPGLAVSTRLTVGVVKDALVAPSIAVQHGPNGLYVYVVDDHNRAALRPVIVAHQNIDEAVIEKGAKEGDRVVTAWPLMYGGSSAGIRSIKPQVRGAEPMHGGFSEPFIKRPIATTLAMVAILLVGIVAYPLLPVAPLPQIDFPTIAGERAIARRVAGDDGVVRGAAAPGGRFAQIPGVSQMTSTSQLGATAISVQFDLDRNIDAAANDIQAAINAASGNLPKNLPSPLRPIRKVNPSDTPILILGVHSDVVPVIDVDDAAENILAQQISQISRRFAGPRRRPADAGGARASRPGQAGREKPAARRRARADRHRDGRRAEGHDHRTETIFHDFRQRPDHHGQGLEQRHHRLSQRRAGAHSRHRRGRAWTTGRPAGRLDRRQARRLPIVIFKQPGSNVIKTVQRIKQALVHLEAAIPQNIKVSIVSDRTTTIRSSVSDVQFTLMLTIALVVMVIFLFLRSVWATLIPSVTVPLALLGACAAMWAASYSLDNLSLMALTIAVGFVVDDAIVVLENITRHIEEGMRPYQAALKGAGEIGFTVVSISLSLIAVLIPLLLMSGIIGRLFREFAVTLAMTIIISAFVSLTLTPMMASRFLKPHNAEKHGRLYQLSERGFAAMAKGYERGLDVVLRHRFVTLLVFLATICATGYLFVTIPKGFFPQQDTGVLFGNSDARQDISFPEMVKAQEQLGAIVQADPAVATVAMGIGAGVGAVAQNNGRMFITLKQRDERDVDWRSR